MSLVEDSALPSSVDAGEGPHAPDPLKGKMTDKAYSLWFYTLVDKCVLKILNGKIWKERMFTLNDFYYTMLLQSFYPKTYCYFERDYLFLMMHMNMSLSVCVKTQCMLGFSAMYSLGCLQKLRRK